MQDSERALKEHLGQREETVAVLENRLQHAEDQLALRTRDTQSWNERENNLLSTIEDVGFRMSSRLISVIVGIGQGSHGTGRCQVQGGRTED